MFYILNNYVHIEDSDKNLPPENPCYFAKLSVELFIHFLSKQSEVLFEIFLQLEPSQLGTTESFV